MARKLILSLFNLVLSLGVFSQTIDEKIGNAMNASDWFALDSIYNSTPADSIHPFLEVYSRCLLGNRLNRPDVSIPAFRELFETQSEYLDLGNLISSTFMFGMDLSRAGQNEAAASMTSSVLDATRQYLDSVMVSNLTSQANRYSALSAYNPYQISFGGKDSGCIPFVISPVGPPEKESVLMHLKGCTINGSEADITFDTGAGTNMITPEMAEKYGLMPLEETRVSVIGVGWQEGYMAIAKELRLGNITVADVPFTVISLSSGNSEADQYVDAFNIVLGSDLMLRFKDLTIDFIDRQIIVPAVPPVRSGRPANICFSPTMNLLTRGDILGEPVTMCIDSGDASYGSVGSSFYSANKEYVGQNGRLDSVRVAGIGGFVVEDCYIVSNLPVTMAGSTVMPTEFVVKTEDGDGEYDSRIGLKTMMLYDRIRFNMVDFVLTTVKTEIGLTLMPTSPYQSPPSLKFNAKTGINAWQALGIVGIGVARTLTNPNSHVTPDM